MLDNGVILQNRYRIMHPVGNGGMSHVYLAADTRLGTRQCAIKEFKSDNSASREEAQLFDTQFQQEAMLLGELNHPNLPKVTDFFSEAGKSFLVMEYIDGESLEEIIDRHPDGLPEAAVLTYAEQLLSALTFLHNRPSPIIFRDLKPGNIMLTRMGQIKLIDFGIARIFKAGSSTDTLRMGTMGYAPPEQYKRGEQTDARSDIYALAATMHHLLTGRDPTEEPPFSFSPIRSLNPSLSEDTERAITRALAYKQVDRWRDTGELRGALLNHTTKSTDFVQAQGASTVQSAAYPMGDRPKKVKTSRPTTKLLLQAAKLSNGQLIAVTIATLVAIVAGAWFLTPVLRNMSWFWFNVPTFAIAAPLVYAATRRNFLPGIAHGLVVAIGGLVVWTRLDYAPANYNNLVLAAIVSGAVIEGMLFIITKKVIGEQDRDEPGVWQKEMGGLMITAVIGYIIVQLISTSSIFALHIGAWLGAAVMAGIGWFIGDLIQGTLFLRQTGMRWRDE